MTNEQRKEIKRQEYIKRCKKVQAVLKERRIYGPDYKVVVNVDNEVVWGCGKVPWDVYKPCNDLVYYNTGNNNYIFTNENIVIGRDDLISFVKHKEWFLAAFNQGILYNTYWKRSNSSFS
jgi:hypothetical protein